MAYWNGHVFFACSDDYLRDYTVENGKLTLSTHSSTEFANPGDNYASDSLHGLLAR